MLYMVTSGNLRRGLSQRLLGVNIVNLLSYPKDGTIVDTIRLLSGQHMFRWVKGDASFGATIAVVIQQFINNYNRYHNDSSLTSTPPEHSLFA
ncbi:hypothetical protein J1N35_021778 [Gossypium stocksii]|uniref:Uncharacterized protein n=1 Tax=Gossypium stocksii TaxID=47602 RepID=A0A9D3VGW2_9ROSI|nr:hypothetical protein J1N35_021778 [Gossypium stocksii]